MPSHSVMSASTVRTIDDVMSLMDSEISVSASLKESQDYIRRVTKNNQILTKQALDEIQSLHSILVSITANTSALIKLMEEHNVIFSGAQATSFFYPICEPTGCPWDFYCPLDKANGFVYGFRSSSGADLVEDLTDNSNHRIVHLRKSINGYKSPCAIRIICSNVTPFAMALNQKSSYEHTIITHAVALFFWPKLQSRNIYRAFPANTGLAAFPKGKTVYQMELIVGRKTTLRKPMAVPEIFHGVKERIESIVFDNTENLDASKYKMHIDSMDDIVYAVYNNSIRFIGDTYGMK